MELLETELCDAPTLKPDMDLRSLSYFTAVAHDVNAYDGIPRLSARPTSSSASEPAGRRR
jgi:hypothetical protein